MPRLKHPNNDTIVDVTGARAKVLQERGYTEVDADDAELSRRAAGDQVNDSVQVEQPAKSARKAEWVEYAEAQGVENPNDYTKDELIEKVGA